MAIDPQTLVCVIGFGLWVGGCRRFGGQTLKKVELRGV